MRKAFLAALCCTGLLLGGYTLHRSYKSWKQNHLLTLAHEFLAKSDGRNAVVALAEVLRSNPQNLEATRLMADLAEDSHSPAALPLRGRVVELDPRSLPNRLALVRTAMSQNDLTAAASALEGAGESDKKTAAYHGLAAAVAAAAGKFSEAEAHFLAEAALEPTNPSPQLNLAVVRLQETNALLLAEARTTLHLLAANPNLRCQALRELVIDALRHQNSSDALELSSELLRQTNALFSDRLLRLDVLRESRGAGFNEALAAAQREAAVDPVNAYELAKWQVTKTGPAGALAWLKTLSASAQTNQPMALLIAECQVALKNWPDLQGSLEHQNWAELEFLRHAFRARALRAQELNGAGKSEWENALKSADDRKESRLMLLRAASQWNWRAETEELLWIFVNRYPGENWAMNALTQHLLEGGQTRSLMALYGLQVKRDPQNFIAKNNLAMTALLLDAQDRKPYELAREVYEQSPANPSCVSTFAFALHLQQKNSEALKLLEQLAPRELANSSLAGYYGLALQAAGNGVKARTYLELALKARLLPEERKLFEAARARA